MPVLTGEELHDAAMAKKSTAGGFGGWAWNEVKAHSLSRFAELALSCARLNPLVSGLKDSLMLTLPWSPRWKVTVQCLGNAPCASFLLFTGFGPRFDLLTLRSGFAPGSLTPCSVQEQEFPLLMCGIPQLLTLKSFSATHVKETSISSWLSTLWTETSLIVLLGGLGSLHGSWGVNSPLG